MRKALPAFLWFFIVLAWAPHAHGKGTYNETRLLTAIFDLETLPRFERSWHQHLAYIRNMDFSQNLEMQTHVRGRLLRLVELSTGSTNSTVLATVVELGERSAELNQAVELAFRSFARIHLNGFAINSKELRAALESLEQLDETVFVFLCNYWKAHNSKSIRVPLFRTLAQLTRKFPQFQIHFEDLVPFTALAEASEEKASLCSEPVADANST